MKAEFEPYRTHHHEKLTLHPTTFQEIVRLPESDIISLSDSVYNIV